jgi:creatinine amidohydrolase/Fe(II)-dependent formamide hydrolase-like protein/mannose-6-phosphate isomerase-like protein (cupin superfamily)
VRSWSAAVPIVSLLSAAALSAQDLDAPRPIEGSNTVFIEEMTWMEVRDALADGMTTVIVGTGGVEQNGPYVASGKHNFVLRATTEAIAHELGNALVAPIVKFVPEGSIDPPTGHMRYHATISVRQETFEALLTDVVASLEAHGFTDIVLIGDSGGNTRGMQTVADRLNAVWSDRPARVHHIPEYYREDMYSCAFLKEELGIYQQPDECVATRNEYHDDYHYSSIIATTDPERIRARQRMEAGLFSINGVDLAPLEQTIENGRRLVQYRAEITARAIRASMASARDGRAPDPPVAVHVPTAELEATIAAAPADRVSDQQIRMIDAGDMNLGVGVVHRPVTTTLSAIQHHKQAEIYRVVSGRGVLVTSSDLADARELDPEGAVVRDLTGPSSMGTIDGGERRAIGAGDVLFIPAGVAHGFSEITEPITYIVYRIDPDQVVTLKER